MVKQLQRDVLKVSDIVFSRGKERVIRSIPVPLQDVFVPVMRGILCLHKVRGKDLMVLVDVYTEVEKSHGTRFFLQDEKVLVHKFLEDCTNITVWNIV